MPQNDSKMLRAALAYAKMGYSVIPIRSDKKPYIQWARYQEKPADESQIRAWWEKWPDANIGVVTGKVSGLTVLDADSEAGRAAILEFLLEDFKTPTCKSPKGWHYHFQYDPEIQTGTRVLTDCDVRSEGGYIIVPPSRNGNGAYAWEKSPRDISPAPMPELLASILKGAGLQAGGPYNKTYTLLGGCGGVNNGSTHVNNVNISFSKGGRDDSLFRLVNHLIKGGMDLTTIEKYCLFFASNCSPPFPEKEALAKIESAVKRAESRSQNLTDEIREIVLSTEVNFSSTFVQQMSTLSTSRENQKKIGAILSRLVKEGLITRVNGKRGFYRRVESECAEMDFKAAPVEGVDLWLPFNLHQLVEIMPGNIIVIAGEPNAGKTALLLNVIRADMRKHEVFYFNSEMGGGELRKRLENFDDISLDAWKFKAYERSENFPDVIKRGKGKINIIDFLELHDEFYKVGGILSEIHQKLDGAIAIVAIQKNPGTDTGLGGFRTLEKPRLALSMSPGKLKIVKAKNWKGAENPNGKTVEFKLAAGCRFVMTRDWYHA